MHTTNHSQCHKNLDPPLMCLSLPAGLDVGVYGGCMSFSVWWGVCGGGACMHITLIGILVYLQPVTGVS